MHSIRIIFAFFLTLSACGGYEVEASETKPAFHAYLHSATDGELRIIVVCSNRSSTPISFDGRYLLEHIVFRASAPSANGTRGSGEAVKSPRRHTTEEVVIGPGEVYGVELTTHRPRGAEFTDTATKYHLYFETTIKHIGPDGTKRSEDSVRVKLDVIDLTRRPDVNTSSGEIKSLTERNNTSKRKPASGDDW